MARDADVAWSRDRLTMCGTLGYCPDLGCSSDLPKREHVWGPFGVGFRVNVARPRVIRVQTDVNGGKPYGAAVVTRCGVGGYARPSNVMVTMPPASGQRDKRVCLPFGASSMVF